MRQLKRKRAIPVRLDLNQTAVSRDQAHRDLTRSPAMRRTLFFLYGLAAYLVFFVTFLYAVGFITGWVVPKHIDSGTVVPLWQALLINLLLLLLFAIQHSGMPRRRFKAWLTRHLPAPIERSTYVLMASLVLLLLFWQWRPIPTVVWSIPVPEIAIAVQALSLIGIAIVLVSTFLINHFELFGLHQVVNNYLGRSMEAPTFKTPSLYKVVRHPIYFGFIVAFWAAPVMTVGHLLFAAVTTAYILVGIWLEERDLVAMFGDDYRRYRERVSMLIPFMGRSEAPAKPPVRVLKTP
jgi:protein-S-isoprenylcysteine O-methyltransferase Ste14